MSTISRTQAPGNYKNIYGDVLFVLQATASFSVVITAWAWDCSPTETSSILVQDLKRLTSLLPHSPIYNKCAEFPNCWCLFIRAHFTPGLFVGVLSFPHSIPPIQINPKVMQVMAAPKDNDLIPLTSFGSSTVTGTLMCSSKLLLPHLWWTRFVRMFIWPKLRIGLKLLAQDQKIATAIVTMRTKWGQLLVRCYRKEKESPTLRTLPTALLKGLWGNLTLAYNGIILRGEPSSSPLCQLSSQEENNLFKSWHQPGRRWVLWTLASQERVCVQTQSGSCPSLSIPVLSLGRFVFVLTYAVCHAVYMFCGTRSQIGMLSIMVTSALSSVWLCSLFPFAILIWRKLVMKYHDFDGIFFNIAY